jgi:hypothetical protein
VAGHQPPRTSAAGLSVYTGSHVSSVRDFSSITSLFSDHTPNISVPENNRVTLSKPRTKDTQEPA